MDAAAEAPTVASDFGAAETSREETTAGGYNGQENKIAKVTQYRSELDNERGQYPQSMPINAAAVFDAPLNEHKGVDTFKRVKINRFNLMREEQRTRSARYRAFEDANIAGASKVRMSSSDFLSPPQPPATFTSHENRSNFASDPVESLQRIKMIDDNRPNLLLGPSMRRDYVPTFEERADAMKTGKPFQMVSATGAHETIGPRKNSRQRGVKYRMFEADVHKYHKGLLAREVREGKVYRDGVLDDKDLPNDHEGCEYDHDESLSDGDVDDPRVLVRTKASKRKQKANVGFEEPDQVAYSCKVKKASALTEDERARWYWNGTADDEEAGMVEDAAQTEEQPASPTASEVDAAPAAAAVLGDVREDSGVAPAQPLPDFAQGATQSLTTHAPAQLTGTVTPTKSTRRSTPKRGGMYGLDEQLAVLEAYAKYPSHGRSAGESDSIVNTFKASGFDREWNGIRKQYKALNDNGVTIEDLRRQVAARGLKSKR
ncbi:hypothetical protein LTR85_011268 [Meristemomyces frigidus]|nr:hypothetical protein LTR85_011268 [Meristemomyces frigidus]